MVGVVTRTVPVLGPLQKSFGRLDQAIADFDEAIRLKPKFAEAVTKRCHTKDHLGQYDEAMVDHDEAIRLKPDYVEAYANRGILKSLSGRRREAITDYDEAIRLQPDAAYVYAKRGFAKEKLGRYCPSSDDLGQVSQCRNGGGLPPISGPALKLEFGAG